MPGYSGTPLVKKLGIRAGMRAWILNAPLDYAALVKGLPPSLVFTAGGSRDVDFIHAFFTNAETLLADLAALKDALAPQGLLWISWPKQSSGISSDLKENLVREYGLNIGLVDVKVCAVDERWSGLKFVYRLKDRQPPAH